MLVPFIRYDAQQARCIVRVGILKAMKIHGFVYCRNNGKACASSTQAIVPSPDRGMFRAAYRLSGPLVCGPYLREAYPIGVVL